VTQSVFPALHGPLTTYQSTSPNDAARVTKNKSQNSFLFLALCVGKNMVCSLAHHSARAAGRRRYENSARMRGKKPLQLFGKIIT
jgi:hypothetical protein